MPDQPGKLALMLPVPPIDYDLTAQTRSVLAAEAAVTGTPDPGPDATTDTVLLLLWKQIGLLMDRLGRDIVTRRAALDQNGLHEAPAPDLAYAIGAFEACQAIRHILLAEQLP